MSRVKFTRSARRTVYLYARPKVENRDNQISITAEPIELIIKSIDSIPKLYHKNMLIFTVHAV